MTSSNANPWPQPQPDDRCPCLSGETYAGCCGRYVQGNATAPTAEALMRSRFTAFATGNVAYLNRSWHASTRPRDLELDPGQRWYRLDILQTLRGGPLDDDGVVAFRAYYKYAGENGSLEETSSFVRENKQWFYVDALAIK